MFLQEVQANVRPLQLLAVEVGDTTLHQNLQAEEVAEGTIIHPSIHPLTLQVVVGVHAPHHPLAVVVVAIILQHQQLRHLWCLHRLSFQLVHLLQLLPLRLMILLFHAHFGEATHN